MEREEKVRERVKKKQEFMGIKLKGGILVGKRRGPCTTPSPKWKHGFTQPDGSITEEDPKFPITTTTTNNHTLSARKLGANLWEVLPHLKQLKMSKNKGFEDKVFELPKQVLDPPDSPPQQPATPSSLRRHVAASLTQHHRSAEQNGCAQQPVSPASYSSSMEVAAYKSSITTPTSSLDFKGRVGETAFNLKTSTELLKVLNRIWSLEEQHSSNMSLVKVMKKELDHSRAQIKELLHEKHTNQKEIDGLLKQAVEDKIFRKNKVQSAREELEDERKLRKHSENLHRKLARELCEVKSSLSSALKELERQKKARNLVEDLCDEFAKGVRDYEQELRFMKNNPEKDRDRIHSQNSDRLVLHLSEAWLDERMQMQVEESRCGFQETSTVTDNLDCEIQAFLRKKRSVSSKKFEMPKESSFLHRHSLESFQLNEAISAPRNGDDEEDSTDCDLNCFELKRASSGKQSNGNDGPKHRKNASDCNDLQETMKSNYRKKKFGSRDGNHGIKGRDLSSSQMQFEEHGEVDDSKKFGASEASQECFEGTKNKQVGNYGLNSNHFKSTRSDTHVGSAFHGNASPVQQWKSKITTPDHEVSESSSQWPQGLKENSLKAKLLEARLESQHSRLKASKGSL